jgi:polyhydroxyalkanoate synthesis regulator phasin
MTFSEIVKKAMLAGLGAQEKAKEFIDELVKAGELSKTEAASLVKEWVSKAEESTRDLDTKVKDAIANAFVKLNIPSRDAIEKLEKKVQNLSAKIDKLEGGKGEGGA